MKKISCTPLIVLAVCLPSLSCLATESQATSHLLEACLEKNANLTICDVLQKANARAQKLGEETLKDFGVNKSYAVVFAGAAQSLAEGRLRLRTSISGVTSGVEISPTQVDLKFQVPF
jgi:hypothetical protein